VDIRKTIEANPLILSVVVGISGVGGGVAARVSLVLTAVLAAVAAVCLGLRLAIGYQRGVQTRRGANGDGEINGSPGR
jgi:hypothetical protein